MVRFEWDEEKAARNLRNHDVDFNDAAEVFDDPFRLLEPDFSDPREDRWRVIGLVRTSAILFVVHLEEDEGDDTYIRMISARRATAKERILYEQNRALYDGRN